MGIRKGGGRGSGVREGEETGGGGREGGRGERGSGGREGRERGSGMGECGARMRVRKVKSREAPDTWSKKGGLEEAEDS